MNRLTPSLHWEKCNELAILVVNHPNVKAKIAQQGAQLLSWQPSGAKDDVLWLSEIEPFQHGVAIRGGVPICYPWFGNVKTPSHGTARLRDWTLVECSESQDGMRLVFVLDTEAKIEMILGETCTINFTHLGKEPAQLALHTYFNIGNINNLEVQGLPTSCFDKLTNQDVNVPSSRTIRENVDCIYATQAVNFIQDFANQRTIKVEHINATETVLWNPWHKPTSSMSENAYQKMVCLETARLNTLLQQNDMMSVKISLS